MNLRKILLLPYLAFVAASPAEAPSLDLPILNRVVAKTLAGVLEERRKEDSPTRVTSLTAAVDPASDLTSKDALRLKLDFTVAGSSAVWHKGESSLRTTLEAGADRLKQSSEGRLQAELKSDTLAFLRFCASRELKDCGDPEMCAPTKEMADANTLDRFMRGFSKFLGILIVKLKKDLAEQKAPEELEEGKRALANVEAVAKQLEAILRSPEPVSVFDLKAPGADLTDKLKLSDILVHLDGGRITVTLNAAAADPKVVDLLFEIRVSALEYLKKIQAEDKDTLRAIAKAAALYFEVVESFLAGTEPGASRVTDSDIDLALREAWGTMDRKDYAKARSQYLEVQKVLPEGDRRRFYVLERLGAVAAAEKKYEAAETAYSDAVKFGEAKGLGGELLADSHHGLADALAAQGRRKAAVSHYKKARKLTRSVRTRRVIDRKLARFAQKPKR